MSGRNGYIGDANNKHNSPHPSYALYSFPYVRLQTGFELMCCARVSALLAWLAHSSSQ